MEQIQKIDWNEFKRAFRTQRNKYASDEEFWESYETWAEILWERFENLAQNVGVSPTTGYERFDDMIENLVGFEGMEYIRDHVL